MQNVVTFIFCCCTFWVQLLSGKEATNRAASHGGWIWASATINFVRNALECNYCGPAHKLRLGPPCVCICNPHHVISRLSFAAAIALVQYVWQETTIDKAKSAATLRENWWIEEGDCQSGWPQEKETWQAEWNWCSPFTDTHHRSWLCSAIAKLHHSFPCGQHFCVVNHVCTRMMTPLVRQLFIVSLELMLRPEVDHEFHDPPPALCCLNVPLFIIET